MHEVMTIKSQGEDELTIGKRNVERLAGVVLAVLASAILISLWRTDSPLTTSWWVFVPPAVLTLWGVHVALSGHRFVFTRHSQVCRSQFRVFGILNLRRAIEFSAVTYSRQCNWLTPGWLYSIILTGREHSRRRIIRLGYVSRRIGAAKLAETIAEFTGCKNESSSDSQRGHVNPADVR